MDNLALEQFPAGSDVFSSDWLRSKNRKLQYARRTPEQTDLYRVVFHHHEELTQVWDDIYQKQFGYFRKEVQTAFFKYLDCGILLNGCARARCKKCHHSILIALSCKQRGICPSCDTKRMLRFAEHLHENVLTQVPHRHLVMSIPKRIRPFFKFNRQLNSLLFDAAWESLKALYREIDPEGKPGAALAIHSGNGMLEFNPHIHGMVTDGFFLPSGEFQECALKQQALQELFQKKLLKSLQNKELINNTVVEQINSWQHSGFSAWLGPQILPADTEARLFISQYLNKAEVKLNKIEIITDETSLFNESLIRCRKDETNFKDYKPLDFLAQLSTFIPNKWEQTVRYLGWYASRTRGKRNKIAAEVDSSCEPNQIEIIPEDEDSEYRKNKRKSWAQLIRKVYEVDPLVCPKCQNQMKIIAVIIDPKEAKKISAHLGQKYRAPPRLQTISKNQQSLH